jgi:hypothetical protein
VAFLSRCRLLLLEQKLKSVFGAFGRYDRYRRLCLERGADTTEAKLTIAQEVLHGPAVSLIEAQDNDLYLRRHQEPNRVASGPEAAVPAPHALQPERKRPA